MWKDTYYQQLKKDMYYIWPKKELVKKEKDHDEVFQDTWMGKKDDWLDYVKNDVSCTTFAYPRYSKRKDKTTGFRMKKSLTIPSLG